MKIDSLFKLRQVADEWILLLQGQAGGEMTRVIAFNETSVMLWNEFHDREFTTEEVRDCLLGQYEVSPEAALRDATSWVETLKRYGVVR